MLTILCGTNQSEKSAQMRRLASEAAKRDASSVQQTVLWLTPDQFTFETERALMYRLQPEVRRKMLVTGFMRFSGMMLKRFGGAAVRYADNLCKTILMRRSLADCKDLLTRYARQAQMEDAQFEGQALSFVRQCKFAGVTPDELLRVSNSGKLPEQLRAKAGDLAQIAMQYEARISSAWRDSLDDLSAAKEKLLRAEERGERYFAGKTVFLDGFKSFTAPQYDLIALMLRQGATVYAALTLDKKPGACRPEQSVFYYAGYIRPIAGFVRRQKRRVEFF